MEVFNFILIVVLLIISAIGFVVWTEQDERILNPIFKPVFFTIILACALSILYEATKLRDKDVFNGKAEYVETIYISKGDTIKTYHIQLKEKK